ncbi:hypothetical protein [Homoserinibacter sp. YIM 151385]|uniref:hypothetical protein n=1 Tax=Homoserinibacter sp. YIM 151385 TaxID=2985506 RepID=UPI0022EFE4C8|nr:hypothetical protein [Homoserinibacter sp. YIM 151385]WBU38353.1 hypothetical protein OF852_01850 [Homoserinibacter sp. YIM 151385]
MSDRGLPAHVVRETITALALRWPTLLAWFLAGWIARILLLRLAGQLANVEPVFGLLVLPLAVLARLASYVAMFLVARDALPALDRLDDAAHGAAAGARPGIAVRLREDGRRLGEGVLDAILPFFLIYAAWAIIDEDIVAYARSALDQIDYDVVSPGRGPLSVGISVLSVSMVVVAFALRLVLRRVQARVPRWTGGIAVYLEAVWVLVTVLVLRTLFAGVPEWLATRRMLAPIVEGWESLRDSSGPLGQAMDALGPALGVLGDAILLPLAWLALAGVVFAGALERADSSADPRTIARLRERVASLPRAWRTALVIATEEILERWEPVRRVATLAWRAGVLPIGVFLLAFAAVQAGGAWLDLGISRLLGPHDLAWWNGTAGTVGLLVELVVTPLQIAVVAGALSAIARTAELRTRARAAGPAAAPAGR